MQLDVLAADKEEGMHRVAVGGLEVNALFRVAVDDAARCAQRGDRVARVWYGDAVAYAGA